MLSQLNFGLHVLNGWICVGEGVSVPGAQREGKGAEGAHAQPACSRPASSPNYHLPGPRGRHRVRLALHQVSAAVYLRGGHQALCSGQPVYG